MLIRKAKANPFTGGPTSALSARTSASFYPLMISDSNPISAENAIKTYQNDRKHKSEFILFAYLKSRLLVVLVYNIENQDHGNMGFTYDSAKLVVVIHYAH